MKFKHYQSVSREREQILLDYYEADGMCVSGDLVVLSEKTQSLPMYVPKYIFKLREGEYIQRVSE
jgi:hypothetical protein